MTEIKQIINDHLFTSPLLGFQIPDHEALNRALLAECAARRNNENSLTVSNQNGWHSAGDLFLRGEDAFRLLCAQISKVLIHVAKTAMPSFDLSTHDIQAQGWVNINPKGGFNTPHDHSGFHWSGCYDVSVPDTQIDRSGAIEFLDPRGNVGMKIPGNTVLFPSKVQFRPVAGTMLIFPSFLKHWVYPNQDDEERVSIAFNARVESKVSIKDRDSAT